MNRRWAAFLAVLALCIAGAGGYAGHVVSRARAAAAAVVGVPAEQLSLDALPAGGERAFLLFRSTAPGPGFGHVGMVHLDDPESPRQLGRLECERVYYAAGSGLCLEASRGAVTTYRALLFDSRLQTRHSYTLAGPPSRARVSADGRLAAFTVFINGHAYDNSGFSTKTSVVATASGKLLIDSLESLPVLRDGKPFRASDFNFWGITFAADGARFYATLGTGGKTFLVQGDLAGRQLQVIHADVECPSLSPDGRHIAFKRRSSLDAAGRFTWHLVVLELATGRETPLGAEARSIDDQAEWLGDHQVVYALPREAAQATATMDVWSMSIDGASAPRLLLPFAFSPAVSSIAP